MDNFGDKVRKLSEVLESKKFKSSRGQSQGKSIGKMKKSVPQGKGQNIMDSDSE